MKMCDHCFDILPPEAFKLPYFPAGHLDSDDETGVRFVGGATSSWKVLALQDVFLHKKCIMPYLEKNLF